MRKIGINMFLWTDFVDESHFYCFDDLKKVGYDGVEIPLIKGNRTHYLKVAQAVKDAGLECTATSCCMPGASILSEKPSERRKGLGQLEWAIDMSAILGATVLGGPLHCVPGEFSGNPPSGNEIKRAVEILHRAAEYSQSKNITLTVEYLNRFENYLITTMETTLKLLKEANHPNLGIHFDTHHAHIEENNIPAAIRSGSSSIKHVHISESNRGIPGTGQVDFSAVFKALDEIDYKGWITLEGFAQYNPNLRKALFLWRKLFNTEEEFYTKGLDMTRSLMRSE